MPGAPCFALKPFGKAEPKFNLIGAGLRRRGYSPMRFTP